MHCQQPADPTGAAPSACGCPPGGGREALSIPGGLRGKISPARFLLCLLSPQGLMKPLRFVCDGGIDSQTVPRVCCCAPTHSERAPHARSPSDPKWPGCSTLESDAVALRSDVKASGQGAGWMEGAGGPRPELPKACGRDPRGKAGERALHQLHAAALIPLSLCPCPACRLAPIPGGVPSMDHHPA